MQMSKFSNESHVVSAAKSRVLLASFVTVLSLYLLLFIYYYYYYYYYYASVNSSCTQPPPPHLPRLLRGICARGHYRAFDTHAVSYQNITTQKDRNKLKRVVVKACCRFLCRLGAAGTG